MEHSEGNQTIERLRQQLELAYAQLAVYARDLKTLVDARGRMTEPDSGAAVRRALPAKPKQPARPGDLAASRSSVVQHLVSLCRKVAASNATVMLTGETGSGKDVTARYIHRLSPRREGPMVAINCAAVPAELMESELFGHEKGAFTDASQTKVGLFEMASGGTLFLDEIGDMPMPLQAKLLRVLEDLTFTRVGGTTSIKVDLRVIAATNRDLLKDVAKGRFREDLYYRLNVFPVRVPALRERPEDIAQLVDMFLAEASDDFGLPAASIHADAVACLKRYHWPGNVRELRNVVERCLLLAGDGEVGVEHLPVEIPTSAPAATCHVHVAGSDDSDDAPPPSDRAPGDSDAFAGHMARQERAMILDALETCDWNKAAAARKLGLSWDNLRYRIKKYAIESERERV